MGGGQLVPLYKVVLHKRARKGLQSLTGNRRVEAEAFLSDFLPLTPLKRVPGKTKKLRGAYEKAGYLQYDLPRRLPRSVSSGRRSEGGVRGLS